MFERECCEWQFPFDKYFTADLSFQMYDKWNEMMNILSTLLTLLGISIEGTIIRSPSI